MLLFSGAPIIPAKEAMPRPCDDCVQMTPMVDDWRAVVDFGYPHEPPPTAVRVAGPIDPEQVTTPVGFRCIYLGDE
jgi:hypothetical protein